MQQVITIAPDGSMSGLQRKPGQGIDLRQFGKADIRRASLIEWDANNQSWFIRVLQPAVVQHMIGPRATYITGDGATLTMALWCDVMGDVPQVPHTCLEVATPLVRDWLYFDEYDDAVICEIQYLDALRLSGVF